MGEDANTNAQAQSLRLVTRAYLTTMGATVLIALLTILLLVDTHSCSSVSRGLAALGGTTAVVFLASIALVGVRAWKVLPGTSDRLASVVVYGVLMLVSWVVFTCGLMVVFNC